MHNCGNMGYCTNSMIETGAKALHFGNKINIIDALTEVPNDVIVMGNIDPIMFKQTQPEQIETATRELLNNTSTYNNFIISTGCDVPPHASRANIEAFYKPIKELHNE